MRSQCNCDRAGESILRGKSGEISFPTITSYELRVLRDYGVKPKNLTTNQWKEIVEEINLMEKQGMFTVK